MSKTPKPSNIRMPTLEEDRQINAAAKSDPSARPLTPSSSNPPEKAGSHAWTMCFGNT